MTAPTAIDMLTIELTGKRGARSYVEMTEHMMCQFGHSGVLKHEADCYQVRRGDYEAREYVVEPDVSAACYFYAAAAVTGGSTVVRFMKRIRCKEICAFGRIGTDGLYQAVGTHGRNRRAGT